MSSPLEFKELTLDSLDEIYPYIEGFKGMSCDYTAGGLFMWIDYFKYKYCVYRDTLFIKGVAEDDHSRKAFSQPLGSLPLSESMSLLSEYCSEHGYELMFSAITEFNLEKFIDLNPRKVYPLPQWRDYVYTMESLATLSGKKLGKKRNHCNRFEQENPVAKSEPISDDNIALVRECFKEICREEDVAPMAQYEREQVWKVLDNLNLYPFETLCLQSEGRVVAFSVGEVVNNVLHVHIEKALREVSGAAETMNRNFARYIQARYPHIEWINRQDDAGDEGLRQAKKSYSPAFLLNKYNVMF